MTDPQHATVGEARRLPRRAVVGAAVWSAPLVVAAAAAPSYAASGTPVLSVAWVEDSFRCNQGDFASGTPKPNGFYGPIAVAVTITGGTVDDVQCVATTLGSHCLWEGSANQVAQRGGTVWARNGTESLALDGWTSSVVNAEQYKTATFTRGITSGTVMMRTILSTLSDLVPNNDFPFTLTFTATGATGTAQIVVNSSTTSPYITGMEV